MFGHSVGLVSEMKRVLGEGFPVRCRRGFGTSDQCYLELVSTLWQHMCVDPSYNEIWAAIFYVLKKDKIYKAMAYSEWCQAVIHPFAEHCVLYNDKSNH